MTTTASTALVTGASRGLGLALARSLAADGWALVVDGRDPARLVAAVDGIDGPLPVVPVAGDLTHALHRDDLATVAATLGGLDLLVLNAGTLGPAPLPAVADLHLDDLRTTLEVNVVGQVGLIQALLPHLRPGATIVAITSDAAVEPYEGWGAYAASKAAFEQIVAVLGVERPDLRVLRIDPGDMATDMYREAAPDDDLTGMPTPEDRVGAIRRLIAEDFPTRRYRGPDVRTPLGGGVMGPLVLPDRVLDLDVPDELIADGPLERTDPGRRRDDVRMLVAHRGDGRLQHAHASDLPTHLEAGDVVVVNTSSTLPAAVPTADGRLVVHLSTQLSARRWVVEVRRPTGAGSAPHPLVDPVDLELPGDGRAILVAPYGPTGALVRPTDDRRPHRLWVADLDVPEPVAAWLAAVGRPIRYGSTDSAWPLSDYQTLVAAPTPRPIGLGSAEMPSAGRPLTAEVLAGLVATGVVLAPITLHCGVSSLEAHEPPYPERYQVPAPTARLVDQAHAAGHRVVAIGTTVTRALETDADEAGHTHPGDGWTDLVITPERGLRVVDGILSGWHEPEASHLLLMEAIAGRPLLEASYAAALAERYRWHEFGDVHLVLP